MITWTDPAVVSAIIQSAGAVLAATIAGIAAAVIGKQFAARKKLEDKLALAHGDIAYLLAVEAEHGRLHVERGERSNKLAVRRLVRDRGLNWSAKFTPGRVTVRHNN